MRFIPLLWILVVAACDKPAANGETVPLDEQLPPNVFYTSLKDSLPTRAMEALDLGDVTGIELKKTGGHSVSYFEYTADKQTLLRVVSQLPFSKYAAQSDTLCRHLTRAEYETVREQIASFERQQEHLFWIHNADEYDIYECIKSPQKHLLLISKHSNKVLHRIEV